MREAIADHNAAQKAFADTPSFNLLTLQTSKSGALHSPTRSRQLQPRPIVLNLIPSPHGSTAVSPRAWFLKGRQPQPLNMSTLLELCHSWKNVP